ncbi:MAG: MFS transporter [Alphaproteobacteria bacterium]|nr:MFS transporter [Alphaproteobacteria bacterium]
MRPVFGLAAATGIYILALGIIIPILPFQILSLGGTPVQATLIYSVFSGVSVLTLRFWGQMSDQFGRTPILWLSVAVTAISYLWLANASTLWEVYSARALAGAFAAWLPVSQALISDVVPGEKRAPAMGLLGVGFGVGFTIGPALGGYLASNSGAALDFWTPVTLAAGICALTLIATIILVREPIRQQRQADPSATIHSIWRDRQLLLLLGLYFGISVLFTGIEGVLAVWGESALDWQPNDVGYLLMIAGLGNILAQGVLIRIATRKYREARTVVIGLIGLIAAIGVLSVSITTVPVIAALFSIAVFMGLHNPAMQSLISQIAPEEWRGKVLGIAQAVSSLARVIGPIWAGLVFQTFGGNTPFDVAFGMGCLLLLIGIKILRPHFNNHDKTPNA